MKAARRREEIVRMAQAGGQMSVEDLARTFDVTPSTIRRDLALLNEGGQLARTYGGAIAVNSSHPEATLQERAGEGFAAKDAIGTWAARQVAPGETVLLDAGTTTARVAAHLRETNPLTVVTNGLTPFLEFSGATDIELIMLGGMFREVSQSFVGPLTEVALERWSFDRVFLGADAVTADRGLCEATVAQTRLKELMARSGGSVYLLTHAEKLGATPFNSWVRLPGRWTLVTDAGATSEQLAPFRKAGVDVIVAG